MDVDVSHVGDDVQTVGQSAEGSSDQVESNGISGLGGLGAEPLVGGVIGLIKLVHVVEVFPGV